MARQILRWSLGVAMAWSLAPQPAPAQGPTIDAGPPGSPGASGPLMGPAPGSGGGSLADSSPGSDAPILGGRAGTAAARVPTSLFNPEAQNALGQQQGIFTPRPKKLTEQPLFGSLALPGEVPGVPIKPPAGDLLQPPAEVVAEGPPDGLTLDMAIERLVSHSLDLRAKFMEIPQAQADVLSAGLRANPIFYADSQLIPYGQYDRSRPGGQTQYDVNISYPLDVTRKRRSRTQVASCAKRVLEAQYQDAVRMAIDALYSAYVDVLAARQTAIYARKSYETLGRILKNTEIKYKQAEVNRADFGRAKVQHENAYIGMLDAEETLKQKKRSLGVLLNLPPQVTDGMDLLGSIVDRAPPPPPENELFQTALAVRPDIVSYRLGVQRAEADVRLAKANRLSDIYVLYQPYTLQNNTPFGLKSPTSWALGVTVPLPVYNRNQGNILRSKLNVTQTQLELATLEQKVITDVQLAEKEYESTKRFVDRIRKEMLPDAQQVMDDTEKLYIGGEKDLVEFLNVQREYNDTVKLYLDTMVRHRRSMLALNTVLAQRVMP